MREETAELLGHVDCPSGIVVLIDGGMLGLWSHQHPPLLDPEEWGAEAAASANSAVDLIATGPDALQAARLFDRHSVQPPYVFDVPQQALLTFQRDFAELTKRNRLRAELVPTAERVPHHKRVTDLLSTSSGVTEVPYHGMLAVAAKVRPGTQLEVRGTRRPEGTDHEGRWQSVWLQLSGLPIARSEKVGHVLVDRARLVFADLDALGAWKQEAPLDGLADVVFWGRDAATAAAQTGATRLESPGEEGSFGWIDLPAAEALEAAERVDSLEANGLKFALDFRPHSHAHQLMAQVRASATESGTVDLDGVALCGFATTWGDGAFEVHRDLAADGSMVRLRIEMGTAERVKLMHSLEERWFGELAKLAMTTAEIAEKDRPVGWFYREAPDHDNDSGWRLFAGDERDEYINNADNIRTLPLREILERHPELEDVLRTPAPCAFERSAHGEVSQVEGWSPPEED